MGTDEDWWHPEVRVLLDRRILLIYLVKLLALLFKFDPVVDESVQRGLVGLIRVRVEDILATLEVAQAKLVSALKAEIALSFIIALPFVALAVCQRSIQMQIAVLTLRDPRCNPPSNSQCPQRCSPSIVA